MSEPMNQKIKRGWFYVLETAAENNEKKMRIQNHGSQIHSIIKGPPYSSWAQLLRISNVLADVVDEKDRNNQYQVTIGADENKWNNAKLELTERLASSSRQELQDQFFQLYPTQILKQQLNNISLSPTPKVLFFESLMNSDMEYNDAEMSQGVLHMVSSIDHLGVEPIFARVKMPIEGEKRNVIGLENIEKQLRNNQIGLVCISLLEGYWNGVIQLIEHLRALGCRAHIAVGGVMPTLTPEHVAAHLPDVSFICRGAGEYFLPKIVQILGDSNIDTPLSSEQLQSFASMKGLIARFVQNREKILITGDSSQVVQVESLNRVPLNLEYVKARHLVGGVEICTSRGCIHRCTFCNIIGRESYQARSAENIIELLGKYKARYQELFGDNIPPNAWRLHIADDDFACDKARAAQFFREILETPFRLSSVQVSIADMCRREGGKLLAELDSELCDVIVPQCFADYGKNLPLIDYIEDHKPRKWSSYLQIGVETFCDNELVRLGKGYRVEHIRAVVREMAARQIHMDAYFIQSNSETTAEDLLEGLIELVRLKIRYPVYFHVRYPPVPHLVSYFPSATHRKHIRKNRQDVHVLRGVATEIGYSEYDYPFVDYDRPTDIWVEKAIENKFFSGKNLYTASFQNLQKIWLSHYQNLEEGEEKERGKRLLRILDDVSRTLLFQNLSDIRRKNQQQLQKETEQLPLELASKILGKPESWKLAFQRFISLGTQRLVLIPTWQCELRCRYCYIRKQDGREMSWKTAHKAIDLLMSSRRNKLMLQFFGGEALLEWEMIQKSIEYATVKAKQNDKNISFIISSNGWSVNTEKLDWLSQYNVKLELSLDGDSETQNTSRRAADETLDSYQNSIATKHQLIQSYGFFTDVIMVVPPREIKKLAHNFMHIAKQGWKRIQINYALGMIWKEEEKKIFAQELMKISQFLVEEWKKGKTLSFINIESDPLNMRLNGEITVDWDGTLHSGNAFLLKGRKAGELILGNVDDLKNFDRYWLDAADNDILLDSTYPPHVTTNNLDVGKILNSFIRWMRAKYLVEIEKNREQSI